jgi:hypothetical protein
VALEYILPSNADPADVQYSPTTGTVTVLRQVPDSAGAPVVPDVVLPPNVDARDVVISPETGLVTVVTQDPNDGQR